MSPTQLQTDRESFLRRILENPFDESLRLIFADWLEENGELERAEFIRGMIRDGDCFSGEKSISGPWIKRVVLSRSYFRQRENVSTHEVPTDIYSWQLETENQILEKGYSKLPALIYTRGFVNEIRSSIEIFQKFVGVIFEKEPVTRVQLLDKEPSPSVDGVFSWMYHPQFSSASTFLPESLWDLLEPEAPLTSVHKLHSRQYRTKEAALQALSRACVEYGRELAGLPKLDWNNSSS